MCWCCACLKYLGHISVPFVSLWLSAERIASIRSCCRTGRPWAWHHTRTHTHTHTQYKMYATHTLRWEHWLSIWVAWGEWGRKMCHNHSHFSLGRVWDSWPGILICARRHTPPPPHTHTQAYTQCTVPVFPYMAGSEASHHYGQNWMQCSMIHKWLGGQRSGPTHCPRFPVLYQLDIILKVSS